ncbi:hypothetical protein K469DRAFT_807439 [Zopfia rhizophila CBS 207.26]|uniref:Uncharacterized protein n=1 Tax=Zopfia rhizophila CBS 207.26 TaxID=1314779 RepID=A0A6A6DGF6_9PEZI|nr:hypothetical protein K469DRAFT_807439 [Zopfia rhizophila CBS 207.26]
MSDTKLPNYPLCLPSYVAAFDDGQLAQQELKAETGSWQLGGYADASNLLILDYNYGHGIHRYRSDEIIYRRLEVAENPAVAKVLRKRKLYDEDGENDNVSKEKGVRGIVDQFNISRKALFSILTKYDIAPAACSHIRGQEQIFGSRISKTDDNVARTFESWYAIRARAYYREVEKDADLKITIVMNEYRNLNYLPCKLKRETTCTSSIRNNPFAISLLHFNSTAKWYWRAARDPRDSVRIEEEKAHDQSTGIRTSSMPSTFDRLENKVTLFWSSIEDLFNLLGRQSARWSVQVGMRAMHESAAMKAIAVVPMVFLPGTFVSSWILLVIMIPFTALILLIWFCLEKQNRNANTEEY